MNRAYRVRACTVELEVDVERDLHEWLEIEYAAHRDSASDGC